MTDNLSETTQAQSCEARVPGLDNSPGSQLQRAREAAGLSREALSQRLCMTDNKLELLERDQYDRLPGAIYVRGYIRNICKELHIDDGPVLQAFSSYCNAEEESREILAHVSRGLDVAPHKNRLRGIVLLPLLLVGAVFWWVYGRDTVQQPAVFSGSSAAVEVSQAAPAESEAERSVALSSREISVADADLEAAPVEPQPAPIEEEAEVESEPQSVLSEDMTTGREPDAADEAPVQLVGSPAAAAEGELQLMFDEESWVEVRDASGSVLLAKLQPAGSQVALTGTPPYQLMLGNARGTQVRYRGQLIDSDPIGTRRTRRLTVGE